MLLLVSAMLLLVKVLKKSSTSSMAWMLPSWMTMHAAFASVNCALKV
ncbi:Uncharacterised protein [Mycobacterium tuberculosis]|nr:Uncharacterised protein [Mycobacterium tuberculosis]